MSAVWQQRNTAHMMQCTLLAQSCSWDDLNKFNNTAKKVWKDENTSLMTRRRRRNIEEVTVPWMEAEEKLGRLQEIFSYKINVNVL